MPKYGLYRISVRPGSGLLVGPGLRPDFGREAGLSVGNIELVISMSFISPFILYNTGFFGCCTSINSLLLPFSCSIAVQTGISGSWRPVPTASMDQNQNNIVILGGSYGGISTAHYVLKHIIPALPSPDSYRVVLASTASQAMCRPACPRAMISDDMFPQDTLFVDIAEQFSKYPAQNFRFVHGTATELDHVGRVVSISVSGTGVEKILYHALVIATGAATTSPLYGVHQGEDRLRASWAEFRKGLATAKSIIIAGGGPTAIESAGELGEFLNGWSGYFSSKLENPKVAITVVTAGSKILPVLRPALAEKAEAYLARVGVTVIKGSRVISVSPEGAGTESIAGKTTVTLGDGKTLDADLYIDATGTSPNTKFVDSGLLAADGRVETNPETLRVDKAGERVYAVGDAASYSRPAVHIILSAIPVLGANIKRDLLLAAGSEPGSVQPDRKLKEDTSETQLVPIGRSKGVGAFMGWKMPSYVVRMLKGRDYWLSTTGALWNGSHWAKES